MNWLPFNMHMSKLMRVNYQLGLSVLPIGLMFSSFLVLMYFAAWLSEYLDIPEGAPVIDQPNGILWIVIFLSTMVVLMILGYLIGWILNAVITRTVLGWDPEKIRRVFLYSEVPNEWLKEGTANFEAGKTVVVINKQWATVREKGKWYYILTRGVFGWGALMYFVMVIVPALRDVPNRKNDSFLWPAFLWGGGGAIFGFLIWYFSEKQYLQALKKKNPKE